MCLLNDTPVRCDGAVETCDGLLWCIMYAHKLYQHCIMVYHQHKCLFTVTFISIVCRILCTEGVLKLGTDIACSICKILAPGWLWWGWGWGGSCVIVHPSNRTFLRLLHCFFRFVPHSFQCRNFSICTQFVK